MVNVAQSVEHQVVALVVVGSIPTVHPILRCYAATYGTDIFWYDSFNKELEKDKKRV